VGVREEEKIFSSLKAILVSLQYTYFVRIYESGVVVVVVAVVVVVVVVVV
jgi:hypothetical protein